MKTRQLLIGAALLLVFVGDRKASALDDAACCVAGTSRLDSLINPVLGGDEKIFTRVSGPPSLVFLIGNSQSMQDYALPIPGTTVNSCGAADAFWGQYNSVGGTTTYDPDPDFPANAFFDPSSFYISYGTRLAVQGASPFDGSGLAQDFTNVSGTTLSATACTNLSTALTRRGKAALTVGQVTTCTTCLTTQGWYRAPSTVTEQATSTNWGFGRTTNLYALSGKFLNQLPPKFVIARKVVKDVIDGLTGVRLGVATFGPDRGYYDPAVLFGTDATGAPSVGPSCPSSYPLDPAALTAVKTNLKHQINNATAYRYARPPAWGTIPPDWPDNTGLYFLNHERSPGEALFALAGFFSSQRPGQNLAGQWGTWFNSSTIAAPSGYPGNGSWIDNPTYTTYVSSGSPSNVSVNNATWVKAGSPFAQDTVNDSFCWSCGRASVVVLTDGVPENDNTVPVNKMLSLVTAQSSLPTGSTLPPGTNTGINFCNSYSVCGGLLNLPECGTTVAGAGAGAAACTKASCDPGCGPQSPDTGNKNFMDDVAYFMSHVDLRPDIAGNQTVSVYTIGFGDNNPMLQSIAQAGLGQFYRADTASQLQSVLLSAISNITSTSTSFSSASLSSIQTATTELTAVMPRLIPRSGSSWNGQLWRFTQFNEFVQNADKNGDGDKVDVVTVDRDGDVIIENSQGALIKVNGQPANPWWEGSATIRAKGWANRNVYTVLDSDADGIFSSADTVVAFNRSSTNTPTATETKIGTYLGILGTNNCPTGLALPGAILTQFGLSVASAATLVNVTLPGLPLQSDYDKVCVRVVIDFVRGRDLADEDGDGDRTETAASALADIFHSSPQPVTPPVDRFLCDFGLQSQCVRTLYSQSLAPNVPPTPLVTNSYTRPACGVNPSKSLDAYDHYQYINRLREKLVIVGANDGMLHAFRDERATEDCSVSPPKVTYAYNSGTSGDEAWAFISPDLLPRLYEQIFGHVYLVDGDTMIRDIWADGSGSATTKDGIKQYDEFHTMIVSAEGRGGIHYMGLEAAFNSSGVAVAPNFRWIFPQPCSAEAPLMGKSLLTLSPKPPPIGPVLIDSSTLVGYSGAAPFRYTYASTDTSPTIPTVERWVTVISGGWSPALDKGRGLYMLDMWESTINTRKDNLWAKSVYTPSAGGQQQQPLQYMTHSIVAPVSLVDYGGNTQAGFDGFFDTAVVGDTHGQVWLARFYKPGRVDTTTHLINNWAIARAFEQTGTSSIANRFPFYSIAALTIQPGTNALRAFLGGGNRYSITDPSDGTCRFDNLEACSKSTCGVSNSNINYSSVALNVTANTQAYSSQTYGGATLTTAAPTATSWCGIAGVPSITSEVLSNTVNSCPTGTGPVNYGDLRRTHVDCKQDALSNFSCQRTDVLPQSVGDLSVTPTAANLAALGNGRFFGIWIYGGDEFPDLTTFEEDKTTSPTSGHYTALSFDTARLLDRGGSGFRHNLVDVTGTTCTTSSCTGNMATANDSTSAMFGWAYEYPLLNNKTATSASVVAGCVLWNGIDPSASPTLCTGSFGAIASTIQADYITGAPNCGSSFLSGTNYARLIQRTVTAPPSEPSTVIQISSTGQIMYSTMIMEPGQAKATTTNVAGGGDVLKNVFQLPLTKSEHMCRHVDPTQCSPNPP